jgi:Fur family ferric uptake transcriptional regulator
MVETAGNIKMTKQRRVILDVLDTCETHPSADELYEMVRRMLPKISLATVYRNLDALSEAGLVQKLEFAGCQKRFDRMTHGHYHIRCSVCGKIEDLPAEPARGIEKKFVPRTDYEITGHKLELIGICPDCRRKKKR